jgi:hypothetical protein
MMARTQPGQKLSRVGTGAGKDFVEAVNEAPKADSKNVGNVYDNADVGDVPVKEVPNGVQTALLELDAIKKDFKECAELAASQAGELERLRAEKENRQCNGRGR